MIDDPTVYVVDDDSTIRILLREALTAAGLAVETFESAEAFLAGYQPGNPGCLVLDIFMPGMNGLELQQVIAADGNNPPIIFLSCADEVSMAVQAMRDGAFEFVQKPVNPKLLLSLVEKAIALDLRNLSTRLRREQIAQRVDSLTTREREVMKWMVRGKSNKAVAQVLDISIRTVEIHRKNVFTKMRAESLVDLVRKSLELEF